MNRPRYLQAPIQNLEDLGRALKTPVPELRRLCANSKTRYSSVVRFKKDGTPRYAWNAEPALKRVQLNIKLAILQKVEFPHHLHGGIRDPKHPRDYVRNAALHTRRALVINEDVRNFFPSITVDCVERIWREQFHFAPEVARCLALLTTRDGELPQGSNASNHLANLVFWDEPELVARLSKLGFRYSRLTDDITISAKARVSNAAKQEAISAVYSMMARAGCRPKRAKHATFGRGGAMKVNGLVVNDRTALPKSERRRIRAEMHRHVQGYLEGTVQDPNNPRVLGRLGKLKRLHPMQAARLKAALVAAKREREG